jgi:Collagen triple helix repeat (20 copies)
MRSSSKGNGRPRWRLRTVLTAAGLLAALVFLVPIASTTGKIDHFPTFNGIDIINGSLTGADIRNKSLTRADFRGSIRGPRGLRGAQGAQGSQGPPGQNGANGAPGAPGAPGTALAYARVQSNGGVDHTRNIGAVSHPGTGAYCLSGLSFTPNNAVASPGFSGSAYEAIVVLGQQSPCPGGTQISVLMYGVDAALHDNDFMININ